MSTSIFRGMVDFDPTLYGAAADPIDTTMVRDGLANGLLHAADSAAQVRVNFCAPAIGYATTDFMDVAALDNNTFSVVSGSPFGEWPLTMKSNGVPYKLRIRAGVSASNSSAAVTYTFRIVIAPFGFDLVERDQLADNVFDVSFIGTDVGTTPTWIETTGTRSAQSRGPNAYTTMMEVTRTKAQNWISRTQIYNAVSSGQPTTTDQLRVAAWVFGKVTVSESGANYGRLHALHISEYVGQ